MSEAIGNRRAPDGGVLLLVHGSPGNGQVWSGIAQRLAGSYQMLTPTLPGHASEGPPHPGSVARTVTVQGGAYAEHRIESVTLDGQNLPVGGRDFTLRLEPGCGARLGIAMRRYANRPTLAFPWDR